MLRFPERFLNRPDAGRRLAARLMTYAHRSDVVVLGLPRGGVPVAAEVASALAAPLDVCVVRKIGVPSQPELAMGAIAEGGIQVLHHDLIRQLDLLPGEVEAVSARELAEVDRRVAMFRDGRPRQRLQGRTVILVDDGLATGATMEAAIGSVRSQAPAHVLVAVPVGASDTCRRLKTFADEVVCLETPEPFLAVGQWYQDFAQTTDDEVRDLLRGSA